MVYNLAIVITYFIEMLISYNFFSQTAEKKKNEKICILIGTLLFECGAFIDIFFEKATNFESN